MAGVQGDDGSNAGEDDRDEGNDDEEEDPPGDVVEAEETIEAPVLIAKSPCRP